jgi:hypothetical protein
LSNRTLDRKEIPMPSTVLNEFEVPSLHTAPLSDVLVSSAWAPSPAQAPFSATNSEWLSASYPKDGSSILGLLVAFGLQALTALALYGTWHFWHLLR